VTIGPPDPKPAERGSKAIKLSPTSYLVLGMVRLGVSSGYAIKKAADGSTQNFWPISLALIYPELARLEDGGLLRRRNDDRGGRARSAYRVTAKGEKALVAWLRSPKVGPVQIRDEGMLKLFLADALSDEDQLALVGTLRERNREGMAALDEDTVPQAEALEAHGIHFVAAAARLSADLLRYAEGWLGRLERKLEGGR
jgi:DNA-binding PadR family transcriptional regulator